MKKLFLFSCIALSVSISAMNNTELHYAAAIDNTDVMQRLIASHAIDIDAVNSKGETALHVACAEGNSDAIQLLLCNGACVNKVNKKRRTPLHLLFTATVLLSTDYEKLPRACGLLVEAGACLDALDCNGDTPAVCARRNRFDAIAHYLEQLQRK